MTTKPKPTTPKRNISYDALIADARNAIEDFRKNDTGNVKLNQRVAWDILCYRELQIADKVKPASWSALHEGGKALSSWRTQMKTLFIGEAPTGKSFGLDKGVINQSLTEARAEYAAKARILDDAAIFCIAIGRADLDSTAYSEATGCFSVPAKLLVQIERDWRPEYHLQTLAVTNKPVPLDNKTYMLRYIDHANSANSATRNIRASLAHVLKVYRQKPPEPGATNAGSGNTTSSLDPTTVNAVLKQQDLIKLALALRDATRDERGIGTSQEDFEPDQWNVIMDIRQWIDTMMHAREGKPTNKSAATKAA